MTNYHVDEKYTELGSFNRIGNFCVLGTKGFSIERHQWGKEKDQVELYKNNHPKKLLIGNHCNFGEYTVIHRGSWRDTEINDYVFTDSRVHISHNCIIGPRTIICTGATILGSCEIGSDCDIWSGAIIHQHVKIGDNCAVGANTYVRHDLPDNHVIYNDPKKGIVIKEKGDTKRYGTN